MSGEQMRKNGQSFTVFLVSGKNNPKYQNLILQFYVFLVTLAFTVGFHNLFSKYNKKPMKLIIYILKVYFPLASTSYSQASIHRIKS